MDVARREALKGLGSLAATAALGRLDFALPAQPSAELPRKDDFDLRDGRTYLNAAYTHPIPRPAADAVRAYLDARNRLRQPRSGSGGGDAASPNPKQLFAQLINAKPQEIAYVPNTSTGENLVVAALGLDRDFKGNVVTDWLHFDGALVHLLELKRRGLDVRVVRPTKDFRIDLADLDRVIDRNTRLVEISSTAMYNGFQHDVKAVCDLAHAKGAYVYADIIHSAGAEPFDVRAANLDFAACSTFKWLMGDYGLGFLFAKEELLDRLARSQVGYYQAADMSGREPPFGDAGDAPVTWSLRRDATGHFEVGSIGGAHVAGLAASLAYVRDIGPARIQEYRQPLLRKLRDQLPRLGFTCVTPPQSTAGIITFARRGLGASDVPRRLESAKVDVRVAEHWLRVSPSIYNDMGDVDRLISALA